ncbi:uncharacterized protein [Asterias amurensis]|uniref:uncharacterized protein n=1 Tax=Asterias amurensis TaxID=7602 RepID=UPI003AB21B64
MLSGGVVNLLVVVLVVTSLSTGALANKHLQTDKVTLRSHHHHHNHRHHGNTVADDSHEKDVFSEEQDTDIQTSQRHENEDDEEVFYDDYSSRRELFQLTDRDGDGFVTRDEYVLHNGNISAVVDQVFMAYDGDGDGRFSEEEFLQQSSPLEVHAECEEQIIQTCDKLYLEFKSTEFISNTLSRPACNAVQYLVDCVAGFDTDCDITSYAQAIASRAEAYLDSGACPLLDLHNLLQITGPDGNEKKARYARSVDNDVEITTASDKDLFGKHCPGDFINHCAKKFEQNLNKDSQTMYCPILASYAHCLKKRSRHCAADVNSPLLRNNMARLRTLESRAKSCHKTYRSFKKW